MNRIPTALRLAASLIWAVTPEYLDIIADIAAGDTDPMAVATQLGRPLQAARTVTVRDGVAIIPVHSVIFRRAGMFDAVSGNVASVQTIATDFMAALNDPAVSSIVLDIDSPGGEVNGISELAHIIHRARGVKPVKAYVGNMAGSAGYWLAAACGEVIGYKTATLGSIGVMAMANISKDPTQRRFISSQSPNKNAPADTARGERLIQDEIDKTAQIFIEDVAMFRGVDTSMVTDQFGGGAMVMAAEAVAAGMADRLGTFEDLVKELQQGGTPLAASMVAVNAGSIPIKKVVLADVDTIEIKKVTI